MLTSSILVARLNEIKPSRTEILAKTPDLDEETLAGIESLFSYELKFEPTDMTDSLKKVVYGTNIPELGIDDFNFELDSGAAVFCFDSYGYDFIVNTPEIIIRYNEEPVHFCYDPDGFLEGIITNFRASQDFVFRQEKLSIASYLSHIDEHVSDPFLATFFKTRVTEQLSGD